jgi:hypothetical protein
LTYRKVRETDMRLLLVTATVLSIFALGAIGLPGLNAAGAAECTGENCPPPAGGQGRGGHCDHERQEKTTS